MLYLTSDHGGFRIKETIKNYLKKRDIQYIDLGPFALDPADDYPLYAQEMAKAVVENYSKGIAICKTGVGIAIALNKFDGIRAGEAHSMEEAKLSRTDDNTNVLVFGAKDFDPKVSFNIIDTWLNTGFSGEERHVRRLGEIKKYEEEN